MLIDSHIHIDDKIFTNILDQALEDAQLCGINRWIIPATTASSFFPIHHITKQHSGCYAAYGLHPYYISTHTDEDMIQLQEMLECYHPIAIGECGLDLMIENPQFELQTHLFQKHIELAETYRLPLIIHARKSLDLVLKILRQHKSVSGVIHAFSGSQQQANQCIDLGFKLGFGGSVTYDRAQNLRKILKSIPIDALLLETDAPFQKSAFSQEKYHQPKDLLGIAQEIAKIRQEPYEYICTETTKNSVQLFNLKEF